MRLGPRIRATPAGFLATAATLALAFGVAHAAGLREEMRFLSGTPANVQLGMLYAILWFSFVLVVPILVIAAALLAVFEKLAGPRANEEDAHV